MNIDMSHVTQCMSILNCEDIGNWEKHIIEKFNFMRFGNLSTRFAFFTTPWGSKIGDYGIYEINGVVNLLTIVPRYVPYEAAVEHQLKTIVEFVVKSLKTRSLSYNVTNLIGYRIYTYLNFELNIPLLKFIRETDTTVLDNYIKEKVNEYRHTIKVDEKYNHVIEKKVGFEPTSKTGSEHKVLHSAIKKRKNENGEEFVIIENFLRDD